MKRGQRGFTLIELLIVVAILGVLAAVVIPNVGRFLGKGKSEAQKAEIHNVQSAVIALMTDLGASTIPAPVAAATNDMKKFPDSTTKADALNTKYKYALRDAAQAASDGDVRNYVTFDSTSCSYTANAVGDVVQSSCP